jgi:sister-chromatid-cohesion protein PDS5
MAVPEEEVEVEEQDEEEAEDGADEEAGDEEMEDDEEPAHDTNGAVARLRFNQTLNWKAGRSIGVADLLRHLDSLARELQGYEQDEVAVDSLQTAAKELASPQLLAHKDKGVKALTASCVVDIFRLCAPNAPYTQQQMKVCCLHLEPRLV